MHWTIHGLQPGMTRTEVLERKGSPLGDGTYGQNLTCIPRGSSACLEAGPVWHYGDKAVVLRDDRVVQVLGNQLEDGSRRGREPNL